MHCRSGYSTSSEDISYRHYLRRCLHPGGLNYLPHSSDQVYRSPVQDMLHMDSLLLFAMLLYPRQHLHSAFPVSALCPAGLRHRIRSMQKRRKVSVLLFFYASFFLPSFGNLITTVVPSSGALKIRIPYFSPYKSRIRSLTFLRP